MEHVLDKNLQMFALWPCNKRTQFRCAISRQFVFPLHVIAYIFMINPVVTQGCRSLGGHRVPVVSRSFNPCRKQIMPTTLLFPPPPDFQAFLRPCSRCNEDCKCHQIAERTFPFFYLVRASPVSNMSLPAPN